MRAVEDVAGFVARLAFVRFGVAEALVDPFLVVLRRRRRRWRLLLLLLPRGAGIGLAGEDLEHEGLVDAVLGVGAGVEAEFDDGVAPGPGAEHIADVLEGLFEGVGVFFADDVVGDGAAGPDGPGGEEGLDLGDGALEGWVEAFEGGEVGRRGGWDGGDVVGDEVCGYFGRGLRVGCCEVAG